MKRTLLIDGDIVAYQAAASVERVSDFGDSVAVTADKGEGMSATDDILNGFMEKLNASDAIVCLSDPSHRYFRHDFFPEYKASRGKKPILLAYIKEHLADVWKAKIKPGLEADDVLGILLTNPKMCPGREKVCVTIDKDLRTIPGLHWNWDKEKKPVAVSELEADFKHMHQTLTGDMTDGYKGLPGCGPKGADKVLLGPDGDYPVGRRLYWERVVAAYTSKGLTAEDALTQARVARICRHSDYDYTNQKAIPWNPPAA